ncbi:MAG: EAL domain-containing protein [Candidatus Thiodiazotropha sp. (ex Troendleina suluensis)]|nr:EAL domain-containing protein [Candidatus Thiodiazotropha sp. (ex Troendleina suluensis)]
MTCPRAGVTRSVSKQSKSTGCLSRRILSQALEQTADIVLITDCHGVIEYVNSAFEQCTGFSREEVLGRKPALLRSGQHDETYYQGMWDTIRQGEAFRGVIVNQCKDLSLYYEEKTISPLFNNSGEITHYVSTGKDVSDSMRTQKRLRHLAYYDTLTGLPNRVELRNQLSQAISHAERHEESLAVLFLDLDRFKNINDSLGHDEGDSLLREVARRLRHTLRNDDTVARNGGDEFIVLLRGPINENDVLRVVDKLFSCMSTPFTLAGLEYNVSASMGISLYPQDYKSKKDLLKGADIAMYQAKAKGGSGYCFFSRDMESRVMERMELEHSLRQGLLRHELVNYYQPQYNLTTGQLEGAEALVRWQHPQLGLVGPGRFIPVAEDTGDIVSLGENVLKRACRQLVEWRAAGLNLPRVSVNLSPRQLSHPEITKQVIEALHENGLEADSLVLELTESALMQHPEQAARSLAELKSMGVRLSVDDFGTGHSSLSYLRRFPLDCVKVDRSFVQDIPDNEEAAALVGAIVHLAHSLKMVVVAEGVETAAQLEFLRQAGCEGAQGYLLGKPMPASCFIKHAC